ncbi:hypothetical protein DFH06DRAFT_3290 [Mycena polygramma]|nr:hypothetical protein DFH06DRAFT_3290 [Mycena polygramma]
MPAIEARGSTSAPNTGLIVALIVGTVILAGALAALLIFFKRRRDARAKAPSATLDRWVAKGERERILEGLYTGHHNRDSAGLLFLDTPSWTPGRHVRVPSDDLADKVAHNYGSDGDEDYELGPRVETAPMQYIRPSPPPDLQVTIPKSPPSPPKQRSQAPPERPPSPSSPDSADSASMYSERSATLSAVSSHMQTIDLASPATPVPALPAYLRPRSELPPEEPPLFRGNTVVVAKLLKSRANRLSNAPERSLTRTVSRIERADSIKEAPSPESAEEQEKARPWRTRNKRPVPPLPLPTHTLSTDTSQYSPVPNNPSFNETLEYYTSQPISPRSPDSVSSYATVRPTTRTS